MSRILIDKWSVDGCVAGFIGDSNRSEQRREALRSTSGD